MTTQYPYFVKKADTAESYKAVAEIRSLQQGRFGEMDVQYHKVVGEKEIISIQNMDKAEFEKQFIKV